MLVLGVYSGLAGRVRTAHFFSRYIVSLLSSRFTASALVWFYNLFKYSVLHFFGFGCMRQSIWLRHYATSPKVAGFR
jgi:hypothetical protein